MKVIPVVAVAATLSFAGPVASHGLTKRQQCTGELISASFGFASCGGHIFVTNDWRHWHDVTPPRLAWAINDVLFINAEAGWVATNNCVAGRAWVHRTRDGGRTWTTAVVRSTNCAAGSRLELSFVDANHGWLVRIFENGNGDDLDRTVDGGRVWARGRLPVKASVVFRTPQDGFAARPDFRAWSGLWTTTDGGRTWGGRSLRTPHGWKGAAVAPDAPTFFGKIGVLPADLVHGKRRAVAFYVTEDGGRRWRPRVVRSVDLAIVKPSNPFVFYAPVSVANASVWWLFVAPRTVAVTTDAGRHWQLRRAPRATMLTAVDGRRAWISGDGLFGTSDGGRSWRRLTPR